MSKKEENKIHFPMEIQNKRQQISELFQLHHIQHTNLDIAIVKFTTKSCKKALLTKL